MSEYVTPTEAAKIIGVKVDHIRTLINNKSLRATNVSAGKKQPRWKIERAELKAFMDRRRQTYELECQRTRQVDWEEVPEYV